MQKPDLIAKTHVPYGLNGFGGADPLPSLARALLLLKDSDVPHYVDSGTALGIYRDRAFIPHDTDIDIALVLPWGEDHYDLAVSLVKRFAKANLPCVRTVVADQQPIQLVFMDVENSEVLVDLELYYRGLVTDKIVHFKDEGYLTFTERRTTPFAFDDINIPLPDPIEDHLEERYGPDWKIPVGKKGDWKDYTSAFTPWP